MKILMIICILNTLLLNYRVKCDLPTVEEMNSKDFIANNSHVGFTAAFGDVNSDKQTDVFIISESGKEILVFLGSTKTPALTLQQKLILDIEGLSLVPADFNGDDMSDILITFKKDDYYSIAIYWGGNDGKFKSNNSFKSTDLFFDEPLVLDANADMIADLFVVFQNQTRGFLIGQSTVDNWNFVTKSFKTKEEMQLSDAYFPHSHSFIDLTQGGSADLVVTSQSEKKLIYEIWEGSSSGLVLSNQISTEDEEYFNYPNIKISPTAFTDFDADGKQDLLISVCNQADNDCKILLHSKNKWHVIYSTTQQWKFAGSDEALSHESNTLHIGDFNLDSFPDILTIMKNKDGIRKAVLLYNDICMTSNCSEVGRQLSGSLEMPNSDHAILAAFYDFSMDGTLDVIVTSLSEEKYTMKAYKNMIADDVTFLRVQVLSGHTEKAVYGVNVPGPMMVYHTTNTMGGAQCGSLGQLSQSAHHSLQLPYVIFGLGRLANFVDTLTVSIPVALIIDIDATQTGGVDTVIKSSNATSLPDPFSPLNYTWPMLIPNSQLYVIPFPQSSPASWKNRVLVTPSQNVITTAMVLLGTCGVLVIATLVLHWMERREDKKEKIQEAYRFHFDAM